MIPSFHSRFSNDIRGMMEWRGTVGYSESCYSRNMIDFDKFCTQSFPDACVITWEIALSYLNYMKGRRDVRCDVAAIRNLGKYQIRKGLDACVFPADYFSYKRRRLPYIMSDEELAHFFDAADNYPYDAHNPLRTYVAAAIFRLQYATGMRPSEVRRLERNDFDFKSGTIYIADSKRHKDRRIAVTPSIMGMCKKFDAIARSVYPETSVFFPNRKQAEHSASSLEKLFHKCWKMAGNPTGLEYCSPYILRHNFATRRIMSWMEEGKDFEQFMPYLSTYMGHQTFRETCYYLHLMPERLAKMGCMDISRILPEVPYER